jgi:hypothetical protein
MGLDILSSLPSNLYGRLLGLSGCVFLEKDRFLAQLEYTGGIRSTRFKRY